MKIGDYVGYAGSWSDMHGLEPAGLIIDLERDDDCEPNEGWAYLLMEDGKVQWFDIHGLEVMFENR